MKTLISVFLSSTYPEVKLFEYLQKISRINKATDLLILSENSMVFDKLNELEFQSIEYIFLKKKIESGKFKKLSIKYSLTNNYDYLLMIQDKELESVSQELDLLFEPLTENNVEVVFGKRKKEKFINRIQDILFKKSVEDFFSPIVLISTKIFTQIPYQYNSNDYKFDIEFPIQVLFSNIKFKEVPISNQNWNTPKRSLLTTFIILKAYLHSLGIFYQKKFDCVFENQQYDLKIGYPSSHTYVINAVKEGSKVIDIGAGPFGISSFLTQKKCEVVTVDMFDIPEKFKTHKHIISDLNKNFNVPIKEYDYLLFLDVIEHLLNPEEFLLKVSEQYGYEQQKLIFTTGNIAFFPLRFILMLGFFNYGKSGILDRTHTRLFTFKSFKKLLEDSNLKITRVRGIPAPFPKAIGNNFLSRLLISTNVFLINNISKSFFSYQIYIETETTPSIEFMIADKKSLKTNEQQV